MTDRKPKPVHDLWTAKGDIDVNPPKLVVHELRTHTAVTMGMGRHALCWRDGKRLIVLPDIMVPAAEPRQGAMAA